MPAVGAEIDDYLSGTKSPSSNVLKNGRARFGIWMPHMQNACRTNLTEYGQGDGGKLLCGLESESPERSVVFSIGSRLDVNFERSILTKTKVPVHTFDCTVSRCPGPHIHGDNYFWPSARGETCLPHWPNFRSGQMRFHKICLGARDDLASSGGSRSDWKQNASSQYAFLTWQSIVSHLGLGAKSIVLKMDIEGFEWPVLESILGGTRRISLPAQIAMEVHYATQMTSLAWKKGPSGRPEKSWQELGALSRSLYDAGYRTISKVDNRQCGICMEYNLMRVFCEPPNEGGGEPAARSAASSAAHAALIAQAPWSPDDPAEGCTGRSIRRTTPKAKQPPKLKATQAAAAPRPVAKRLKKAKEDASWFGKLIGWLRRDHPAARDEA